MQYTAAGVQKLQFEEEKTNFTVVGRRLTIKSRRLAVTVGGWGQGCIRREQEGEGGGGGGAKFCGPKMARSDFPHCRFHFFARWSLCSGGGGGAPPMVVSRSNTSLVGDIRQRLGGVQFSLQ